MNIREEFFKSVSFRDPDECWEWLGNIDQEYGRLWVNEERKYLRAHRLSFEIFKGPIPRDKPHVLHSCDNPPCVNPRHLSCGTHEDNMRQMVERGRSPHNISKNPQPGESNGRSRLTEKDVREILVLGNSLTHQKIADRFNVSRVHVSDILAGRRWKHLQATDAG